MDNNRRKMDRQMFLKPFFALILLSFSSSSVQAVWTDVSPPSGSVFNYALSPSSPQVIFATNTGANNTEFGVWRSTDSGANWTQVENSAIQNGVGVSTTPTIVIAGIQGGAIQISTMSGDLASWGATTGSNSTNAWQIAYSPATATRVYAGGSSTPGTGALQVSNDSGANWTTIALDGDMTPSIFAVATHPTDGNIAFVGANPTGGLNDGLYKTTNGGTSWTRMSNLNFTLVDTIAVDPNDGNIIYAGTSGTDEIWRSTDGGSTWSELLDASNAGLGSFNLRGLAIDPDDSRVIYAAGGSAAQVIASVDCGATWTDVSSTGITGSPANVMINSTNNFVYVVENILNGVLYQETLGNGLAAANGSCPMGTSGGGSGGGGSSSSGGGGGGGAFGYLALVLLVLRSMSQFRGRKAHSNAKFTQNG